MGAGGCCEFASSGSAGVQSFSEFPACLEIAWIAPKANGCLARDPGAWQKELEAGTWSSGNCVQQSQVSPKELRESQAWGAAAGDGSLISKAPSRGRFPRLGAVPGAGAGNAAPVEAWERTGRALTCGCFCLPAEQSPSPRMKKVQGFGEMPVLGNGNGNPRTGFKKLGGNPSFMDEKATGIWGSAHPWEWEWEF